VNLWASSSGDSLPSAVATQLAAQKEFNLKGATTSHFSSEVVKSAREYSSVDEAGRRAFLRTIYNETQADFARRGIKEITVVRGMGVSGAEEIKVLQSLKAVPFASPRGVSGFVSGQVHIGESKMSLQPMSSFTTSLLDGHTFAGQMATGKVRVMIMAKIPVESVLSTPLTGIGATNEREVVLLGKATTWKVLAWDESQSMPSLSDVRETWK
jgi:hypothetical protein